MDSVTVGIVKCRKDELKKIFEWNIDNIFSLRGGVNSCFHSPSFEFLKHEWHFELYPNGESIYNTKGWIAVYLRIKGVERVNVQYNLEIKTGAVKIALNNTNKTFDEMHRRSGASTAILRSEIAEQSCHRLTISVNISKNVSKDLFKMSENDEESPKIIKSPEELSKEKALEDFGKLWISGAHSDVVVEVHGVEFKAHWNVLSARIPAFCAMYQHDTKEKASCKITINDCDPHIVKEFLHYIYEGKPKNITAQNSLALYCIADKYLALDLKLLCKDYMQNSLCIKCVCNVLELALLYEENDLLQKAVNFAVKNMVSLTKTDRWKVFVKEQYALANELFVKALEFMQDIN